MTVGVLSLVYVVYYVLQKHSTVVTEYVVVVDNAWKHGQCIIYSATRHELPVCSTQENFVPCKCCKFVVILMYTFFYGTNRKSLVFQICL